MKKHLPLIVLVLAALAGFIDSSLIHLKEIAAKTDANAFASCSLNSTLDCGAVAASRYAHLLGLPVSQLGMYFYEGFLVLGLILLAGWKPQRSLVQLITIGVVGGLIFSCYLLYMSYFAIGSFCIYCLISNLSTLVLTVAWFMYALPLLRSRSTS